MGLFHGLGWSGGKDSAMISDHPGAPGTTWPVRSARGQWLHNRTADPGIRLFPPGWGLTRQLIQPRPGARHTANYTTDLFRNQDEDVEN